jgi:hypothetical protein
MVKRVAITLLKIYIAPYRVISSDFFFPLVFQLRLHVEDLS